MKEFNTPVVSFFWFRDFLIRNVPCYTIFFDCSQTLAPVGIEIRIIRNMDPPVKFLDQLVENQPAFFDPLV
jgi:hypothetical protein